MNQSSCGFTSSPAFGLSTTGVVSIWRWTSFHILICHLYIFFGEVSVKVICSYFNQVVFLLLSFNSSFYVLNNSPLSHMSFANIFSLKVASLSVAFSWQYLSQSKTFHFNEIQLIDYSLHSLMMYLKSHHNTQGHPGFLLCYLQVSRFCISL